LQVIPPGATLKFEVELLTVMQIKRIKVDENTAGGSVDLSSL